MSNLNDRIHKILEETPIDGVDYADGLTRFGNQPSIYLRIIKSFIKNTPASLEELASVTSDTLDDYAVRVHGLKGSCYGISAVTLGDEAKSLEIASKASDWPTVEQGTPLLIAHTNELITQLQSLVDKVEQSEDDNDDQRPVVDAPDRELLHNLLEATRNFDVEAMQQIIEKLDAVRYRNNPRLVADFREQLTNFRYDLIEDKARELLS
jgi:HPt (histidine-containing phosphotransfer) domain-containing protein